MEGLCKSLLDRSMDSSGRVPLLSVVPGLVQDTGPSSATSLVHGPHTSSSLLHAHDNLHCGRGAARRGGEALKGALDPGPYAREVGVDVDV